MIIANERIFIIYFVFKGLFVKSKDNILICRRLDNRVGTKRMSPPCWRELAARVVFWFFKGVSMGYKPTLAEGLDCSCCRTLLFDYFRLYNFSVGIVDKQRVNELAI